MRFIILSILTFFFSLFLSANFIDHQSVPSDASGHEYLSKMTLGLPQTSDQRFVQNAGDHYVDPSLKPNIDQSVSNIKWRSPQGETIITPYIQANGVEIAPDFGAGTWFGNGSVDDDLGTHFHGHTPGDFAWLFQVKLKDIITITDDQGKVRDYQVTRIDTIDDQGYSAEGVYLLDQIILIQGESINLQTCYDDDWNLVIHAEPL